jgi:hypothetical protein
LPVPTRSCAGIETSLASSGTPSPHRADAAIPADLQPLIADIAAANRTSGEERIAAELRLKLGHRVAADCPALHATESPATRRQVNTIGITTRRILHWNLTAHPTRGPRMDDPAVPEWSHARRGPSIRRHDRDAVFARAVDDALGSMFADGAAHPATGTAGERVLRTTYRHRSARVPRLDHSAERTALASGAGRVDHPLRHGTATFRARPGAARRPGASHYPDGTPPRPSVARHYSSARRWPIPSLRAGPACVNSCGVHGMWVHRQSLPGSFATRD